MEEPPKPTVHLQVVSRPTSDTISERSRPSKVAIHLAICTWRGLVPFVWVDGGWILRGGSHVGKVRGLKEARTHCVLFLGRSIVLGEFPLPQCRIRKFRCLKIGRKSAEIDKVGVLQTMLSDSEVGVRCNADADAALSSWDATRFGWEADGTFVSLVTLNVKHGVT
jgi:hypothetical protein